MLKRLARQVRDRWQMLRLSSEARAVLRDRLTYLPPTKIARLEATLTKVLAHEVPGDLLEFGVALGGTAILQARHASRNRTFHGFDVFGMIPRPSERDGEQVKERYETIRSGKSAGIRGDLYYGYRKNLFEEVKASFARPARLPLWQDQTSSS